MTGYRQMTSAVRINHDVQCTREQVARLLKQEDPHATMARLSNRLISLENGCFSYV